MTLFSEPVTKRQPDDSRIASRLAAAKVSADQVSHRRIEIHPVSQIERLCSEIYFLALRNAEIFLQRKVDGGIAGAGSDPAAWRPEPVLKWHA